MSAELPTLAEPYELLDLEHANSIQLRIDRFERGSMVIHPKNPTPRHVRIHMDQRGLAEPPAPGTPLSVEIPVVRVWGERLDAVSPLRYWDITSKTLQADLLPRLTVRQGNTLTVRLTANGHKPTKRYSVEEGG
jgi:hypothetical protein